MISSFSEAQETILQFLDRINLNYKECTLAEESFLDGVLIKNGVVCFDSKQLLSPGDILHEAGHLALLPPDKRAIANGNIAEQFPEEEGSEMAVILWTWLAAQQLEIAPELIFHPEGYKGDSEWLIAHLNAGNYLGSPLLQWMGVISMNGGAPKVERWVRA